MTYRAVTEHRANSMDLDDSIVVLEDSDFDTRVELWPARGFNCYHWRTRVNGVAADLLHADSQFFEGSKPTRTGIPILFPFPNRIRSGRYQWQGKSFQLPLNGPSGKNAIHGFACYRPWRVVDLGADNASAWVAGEFRGSVDAAEVRDLWPVDYQLRLTYRLQGPRLLLEAKVSNPGQDPLPWGLGFHPYFRVPLSPDAKAEDCLVYASATEQWQLNESLPTGKRIPVAGNYDLTQQKPFAKLQLDDVFTSLKRLGDKILHGRVIQQVPEISLSVTTSTDFAHLVMFTPPHRQAVCLEPYTCVTDAINLQQQKVEAGLRVLDPGEEATLSVELAAGT